MIVIADTSGLLAAFGKAEPEHDAAVEVLSAETFVLSPLVLTELHHLADQRDFRAVRPLTAKFDAFKILPADCL